MSSPNDHNNRTHLRNLSLRATPVRVAILDLLESIEKPLDVASIFAYLQKKHIEADMATVFRVMHAFTDKGLTRQVELSEGKTRYELAGSDHHHLICEQCGNIADISDCNIADLEKDITQKKGFTVKRHALEFFGLCQNCQQ